MNIKKFFFLFSVFLLSQLFIAQSLQAVIYIENDFDAPTFVSGLPEGWDNSIGTTSADYMRWNRFDTGYNGACLRFDSHYNSGNNTNLLMTPAFALPNNSDARLSFMFKNPAGGKLSVYTTIDDGETLEPLEEKLVADMWTSKEYSLSQSSGKTIRIVFYSVSNFAEGDAYHYLDNVIVGEPSLCAAPINIAVSSLTQSSVTLSWEFDDGISIPDYYRIKVSKVSDGEVVFSNNRLEAFGNVTTVSSLEEMTEYVVTLQSDCQSAQKGFSIVSKPFRFTTLRQPKPIPYSQNFDTSTDIPDGIITQGDVTIANIAYGMTGYSLRLGAYSGLSSTAILPQLSHAANDLQFAAQVRASANDSKYVIYMSSDPSDPSSFMPVYEGTIAVSGKWYDLRFNTSEFSSNETNMCFAIMALDGKSTDIYFDDIRITKNPTCPRPEQLEVSNIDSIFVNLQWVGCQLPISRQVLLTSLNAAEIIDINSNPVKLDGLIADTKYSVQVRDICSVGDTSEWSIPVSFRTKCGIINSVDFIADFNDGSMPACWTQRQIVKPTGSGGTDWGDYAWEPYSQTAGRQNVLQHKDGKAGAHTLLVAQAVYIDEAGKYDIEYLRYRNNGSQANEGVTLWINNTPDTIGAQKCGFIPSGYTLPPVEDNVGWYNYKYTIEKSGVVFVMFEGISQWGQQSLIDDVKISLPPTCRPIDVKGISLTDATMTTIKLNWTSPDNAQSTIIRYTLNSESGSITNEVEVINQEGGQQSYQIQSLTAATLYHIECQMANYCGDVDTSAWITYSADFATKCDFVSLPIEEDFESSLFPPTCWETYSDNAQKYWQTNTFPNYITSGSQSLMMITHSSSVNPLFVSPKIDMISGESYRVMFNMNRRRENVSVWDDSEGVRVLVNSTPSAQGGREIAFIYSNKELAPVETAAGMHTYRFDFEATSTDQYIILEGITGRVDYIYLDDIIISETPSCLEIGDFTFSDIEANQAVVAISDPENTVWEIQYGPKDFQLGEGTTIQSTSNNATLLELASGTVYDVYLRRVCGGDYSEWSVSKSFKTLYTPFDIANQEYFEGFETYGNGEEINDYFVTVSNTEDLKPSYAASYYYGNSAYAGNMFAHQDDEYDQIRYIPVMLKAGLNYEASGYFNQNGMDNSPMVTIVLSQMPTITDYTTLATASLTQSWSFVAGSFNVEVDGLYYVGYRMSQSPSVYYSAMDNLRIRVVPCIPPTSSYILSKGTNFAGIEWGSNAEKWEVKVSNIALVDFNENRGIVFDSIVTNKSVFIEGLIENTEYYYSIRSICDEAPSDWIATRSFRTECDALDVPYIANFEDEQLSELTCWNIQGENPRVSHSATSKVGNGAIRVETAMLVSPKFNVNSLSEYMISGWVMSNKENVTFEVGVMNNPYDIESYEPIGVVDVPQYNQWQRFSTFFGALSEEDFSHVAGAKYIVLQVITDGLALYFDDIQVNPTPSCPYPTEPKYSGITDNSFTLNWKANGDETSWRVLVTTLGDAVVTDDVVSATTFIAESLANHTTYKVFVSAVCADGSSESLDCGLVTTQCSSAETLPYILNLDREKLSLPICWTQGETATPYNDWEIVRNNGNSTLKYSFYDSYTPNHSSILTPVFDLTNATTALIESDITNYCSGDLEIIVHNQSTAETDTVGRVSISYDNIVEYHSWDISQHVGEQVKIEFRANAGNTYGCFISIHSLMISERNTCARPIGINIINIASSTVDFEIVDTTANIPEWQYVYGPVGFDPNQTNAATTSTKKVTIGGLADQSTYDIYVRTSCDATNNSYWFGPVEVRTTCSAVAVPYEEGFEDYTTSTLVNGCFTLLNEHSDKYGNFPYAQVVTGEYHSRGVYGLKMYSSATEPLYLVLPEFVDALNTLKLTFDYRNESEMSNFPTITVGVMTSEDDFNTFVPVYTCPLNAKFSTVSLSFDTIAAVASGFSGRIAFRYNNSIDNSYLGLDAIRVSSIYECMPVTNIKLTEVDASSFVVNMETERMAAQYQIAYGIGAATAYDCQDTILTTNPTATIENLTNDGLYSIFARSICGEEDTTAWFGPVLMSVNTCNSHPLALGESYVEDFNESNGAFPDCLYRLHSSLYRKETRPAVVLQEDIFDTYCMNLRDDNAVVLPYFGVPAEQLLLSLQISGSGKLYIGTTDKYDLDSIETTVSYSVASGGGISKWDLDMSQYQSANGNMIVLYSKDAGSSLYIDSIKVTRSENTCLAPRFMSLDDLSATSATISWRGAPAATMYAYEVKNITENLTEQGTTTACTLNLETLSPETKYQVRVRTICGDVDTVIWKTIDFTTDCQTIVVNATNPYFEGFENYTDDNSLLNECWKEYSSDYENWKVRTRADSYQREAYEGSNYVTLRYGTNSAFARNFQLEGGKNYHISYMYTIDAANSNCSAMIVWRNGDREAQLATEPFTPKSWSKIEYDFVAPTTGVYTLGLRVTMDFSPYYATVDNFSIEQYGWSAPEVVSVANITSTSADIAWVGSTDSYQVQVLNDRLVVLDTTDVFTSLNAQSLSPSTLYTVRVRSSKDGMLSKWTTTTFTTGCDAADAPYFQTFTDIQQGIPSCWYAELGAADINLNDTWKLSSQKDDGVLSINVSNARGHNTIQSCPINIDGTNDVLSFDYYNDSNNDSLVVVLSNDKGITFTDTLMVAKKTSARQNFSYSLKDYDGMSIAVAFIVNASNSSVNKLIYVDNFRVNCQDVDLVHNVVNICPNQPFIGFGYDIPASATSESGIVEFTKTHYATTIGQCDYVERLILNIGAGYTNEIDASICEGDVYDVEPFTSGLSRAGKYVHTFITEGGCDSTIILNLSIRNPRYSFEKTICDTDPFDFGGKLLDKSGVYADTISVEGSCDSIVTLTLTVVQTRFENSVEVCEGTKYEWQDTILTTTGVYERISESTNGCNRIDVINFTVLASQFSLDTTICYGQSVQFGVDTYSATGKYTYTFENKLGCDSIVTLTLTVLSPDTIDMTDYACQNYPYSGNGFDGIEVTADTVLYRSVKDAEGCVAISRINVDFIETVYSEFTEVISTGDSYNFCGNTYTVAGDYTCTMKSLMDCDSIVTLHLQVGTGYDNLQVQSLIIAPNPIHRDEISYVNRDWSAAERQNMVIEVINSVGQVVSRYNPTSFPVTIASINVSGAYYIRITTGTGQVYIGKLIVD